MAYNFNPVRNPAIRRLLESIFDTTDGHDHDGANSKAIAGVVGDDSVTNAKLATDVKIGSLAALTTTAKDSVVAAIDETKANADARYTKPGTGIPASDMAAAVQTSLGLADTALQEVSLSESTPVNAVAASKDLTISGVVVADETVTIDGDVYVFTAGVDTSGANIQVDIEASTTKSTGTLTVDTQPTSGDTMTIGTKEYTFVPAGTASGEGQINLGGNVGETQPLIVAAINGTDSVNTANDKASAGAFGGNTSTITALVGGVAGDSIASTSSFAAGTNEFGAVTLGSGADCTEENGAIALVAADATASVTLTRATAVVTATAATKGVAGNSIAIAETMANGAWDAGATELSGGVDGTVGAARELAVDASYLYVAVAANTIADANWRRIDLGSAY